MPMFDWDGTVGHENSKAFDWDGTTSHQLGKGYDWDGTTNHLIYSDWNGELLDGADKFEDLTGGYDPTKYTGNTYMVDAKNTNSGIEIYSGSGTWHETGTVNKINISDFSKITFIISCPNGCYTLNTYFGLYNNQSSVYNTAVRSVNESNYTNLSVKTRTYEINITDLTGSYYLALYCVSGSGYPVTITKITMS